MAEAITLKGGQVTLDPRLDRVEQFDERSRAYGIVPLLTSQEKTRPRSYTWGAGPVTDQGREGACVGHAWTGELTAKPKACRLEAPGKHAYDLYREAQFRDEWPGQDYDGTSVLAAAQILQDRGLITEFRWAFGLDELVLAIGRHGPAVLGIPWHEGMYDAPGGVVRVTGKQVGGHAILARGVSLKGRYVVLRNSWGPDWGIGGDARIGFDDLSALLQNGGEACIPVVRAINTA